jgi:hypothetical protein
MRKFYLIGALAVAACAVVTPAEAMKDVPITNGIVLESCGDRLQFGAGAWGGTICSETRPYCTDYSCNMNAANGARLGCYAVGIGYGDKAKLKKHGRLREGR